MSHKNHFKTVLTALAMSAALLFAPSSSALTAYSQDFEGMTPNQGFPPNDLSDDGWEIYGFAWDADPTGPANLVYEYGPFDAANGEPGSIQGVATDQGGPDQGDVVLAKYSDYNNTDQSQGPCDPPSVPCVPNLYIQAITFQTQTIAAGDVGDLWRFTYDAKIGNLEADSRAFAYIQTLDSTSLFQKAFVANDSTNLPIEWGTYTLDLFIDGALVGDTLQFGFSATSTAYRGSGVLYDNLSFVKVLLATIDIKPGNKRNIINPYSMGGIWVAVLSDNELDPLQVDIPTVRFGPDEAEAIRYRVKDVNKDGLGDLLLRFNIRETGIACGDTETRLIGEIFNGQSITGTDSIETVGCNNPKTKKKKHKKK
ncbi:MAG: hypothetical protein WBN57_01895 [Gammaproteobacteria bacterium]